MKNLVSALGFLTLIPTPEDSFREDGRQILYFPLIGLLIGAMLWAVDTLAATWAYGEIRIVLDVLCLAVISGALHLDGLADSADGLFAHRSRERALEIMKDPRIGTMGTLAVFFCILLKLAGLIQLTGDGHGYWLLAVPAYARTGQVAGLVFMNYARSDGGKSTVFFQKGEYGLLAWGIVPLALPFAWGIIPGLVAMGTFLIIVVLSLWFFKSQLGGVTGDTLGALTELVESALFVAGGIVCMNL